MKNTFAICFTPNFCFSEFLPQACPAGNDMILDCEVLLVDTNTGQPLPFGTLGVHKKTAFANASVCLFIFDCLLFNEETLVEQPLAYRKKILYGNLQISHLLLRQSFLFATLILRKMFILALMYKLIITISDILFFHCLKTNLYIFELIIFESKLG